MLFSKLLMVGPKGEEMKTLEKSLSQLTHTIEQVTECKSALAKIQTWNPDLILIDVHPTETEGVELSKTLKSDPEFFHIPVVLLADSKKSITQAQVAQSGADDLLIYPLDTLELSMRVKSLLRLKFFYDQLNETCGVLEEKNRLLENKNRILEEELLLAKELQKSFMPRSFPEAPTLAFAHCYLPALKVGGDFYDLVSLRPHRFGVFMADVSGHGVFAAMVTVLVKLIFQSLCWDVSEPDQLLRGLHNKLMETFPIEGTYISAFYGIIDTQKDTINYVRGGFPYPLLWSNKKVHLLNERGPIIGMDFKGGVTWIPTTVPFKKEDRLFLFTDGVYEPFTRDPKDPHGMQRFYDLVKELAQTPLSLIVPKLVDSLEKETRDDLCFMAIEHR